MQKYLIIRVFQSLLALLAVTIVVFILSRVSGSPVDVYLDITARPAQVEELAARWGFNRPWALQYFVFLGNAFRGDLGDSLIYPGLSATGVVMQRFPATLQLSAIALVFAILIAVPIGVLSAVKRDTPLDFVGKTIAILGQSVPNFWLGIMAMWVFAVQFDLLPPAGKGGIKHFILPAITLGWFQMAAIMRLVRSSMLEALSSEYVKLARVKGLPEWKVVWKHCFRNAALSPLTYFGFLLALNLTGSVTTETVFQWPGTGLLAFQAVLGRDFAVINTLVLLFAGLFILSNLMVDILYAYLDPRIRYT